ncbi:MAG: DNA repair exonuclease, partial [Burkholderiaceae bacterium]
MLSLLHTADWQIGRLPAQAEPDDANALYEARLDAVRRLAALAREQAVDAVLVAGDVFDAQTVSDKAIRRLFGAMDAYDGPWLLLPGNHDAALGESVWRRALRLGVVGPGHRLCLTPESLVIDDKFQLLTAPLTQRHTHHDLTAWFDDVPAIGALPRIGLAHGSVQGVLPDGIDSPNPIAAQRAARARLDYLALGDWHGTRRIDERTWYAGTPETDRFRANDSGQALLVRLAAPGEPPRVQPVRSGRYRWQALEPAIRVDSDVDALIGALGALGADDVARVRPTGHCDVAA